MSWPGSPGSGDMTMSSAGTLTAGRAMVWNRTTAPASGDYTDRGILYVQSGHLLYLSPLGTLTNVASA